MKEFHTWAEDLADSLSKKLDDDLIPGLELTPWVGNRQGSQDPNEDDDEGDNEDFYVEAL